MVRLAPSSVLIADADYLPCTLGTGPVQRATTTCSTRCCRATHDRSQSGISLVRPTVNSGIGQA